MASSRILSSVSGGQSQRQTVERDEGGLEFHPPERMKSSKRTFVLMGAWWTAPGHCISHRMEVGCECLGTWRQAERSMWHEGARQLHLSLDDIEVFLPGLWPCRPVVSLRLSPQTLNRLFWPSRLTLETRLLPDLPLVKPCAGGWQPEPQPGLTHTRGIERRTGSPCWVMGHCSLAMSQVMLVKVVRVVVHDRQNLLCLTSFCHANRSAIT